VNVFFHRTQCSTTLTYRATGSVNRQDTKDTNPV
jgi:hypothetical protein